LVMSVSQKHTAMYPVMGATVRRSAKIRVAP
jgi:hypothetical protein